MLFFLMVALLLAAGSASPLLAHGGSHEAVGVSPWSMWQFSPEIIVALIVAALVHWRGNRQEFMQRKWRILAFNGGLLALFVALISPIERLADHIFAIHQIEHMLLRTVAPMLIFLSLPQAALVRGLPRGFSRMIAKSGWISKAFSVLRHPAIATGLFLLAGYFWMIPAWHDLAILDEPVHYIWHVSLLVSGLIFFSVIFDRRMPPHGPGLGARLGMFVAAALGNIILGAFLTFKTVTLYSAYETIGHMWDVSLLTDEQTGGIIMWIPGAMMFAIAAAVTLHRFGSEEERIVGRRLRTGRELMVDKRSANQTLALGLVGFALLMLAVAFSVVAVIDHPQGDQRDFGMAGEIPG